MYIITHIYFLCVLYATLDNRVLSGKVRLLLVVFHVGTFIIRVSIPYFCNVYYINVITCTVFFFNYTATYFIQFSFYKVYLQNTSVMCSTFLHYYIIIWNT